MTIEPKNPPREPRPDNEKPDGGKNEKPIVNEPKR